MGDVSTDQWVIDNLDYPPTHQYDLETLKPKGVLVEREALILKAMPNFYKFDSFLDIGANKGYFSKKFLSKGKKVLAVEPDSQFHPLLKSILDDANIHLGNFASYIPESEFEIVWIGNAHHYLEQEAPNYLWLKKLHSIVTKYIIIEGPTEECAEINPLVRENMSIDKLVNSVRGLFELVYVGPSVSYTPGRKMFILEKIEIPTLSGSRPLEIIQNSYALELSNDKIAKYSLPRNKSAFMQKHLLSIANILETNATKITEWIDDASQGNLIGWREGAISEAKSMLNIEAGKLPPRILSNLEKQSILMSQLKRTIELATIGYFDDDFGFANWVIIEGNWKNFDKNSIYPIKEINSELIKNVVTVFELNYKNTPYIDLAHQLIKALSTKEPKSLINWAEESIEIVNRESKFLNRKFRLMLSILLNLVLRPIYRYSCLKKVFRTVIPKKLLRKINSRTN